MGKSRKAVIVGAGIGGLAAGLALRRADWTIRIYERAASPRELGFGLLLAPNALAALRELGVAHRFDLSGMPTAVEIRQTNGLVIRRFNAHPTGPSFVALRADLHGALLNALGEEVLVCGREVVSLADDAGGLRLMFKDGNTDTATVVIGADGVNSVIRRTLHPNEAPPRSSGFCAIRGVAYGVSDLLGGLVAVGYLDDGIEAATVRAGDHAVYWYLSLLSDELSAETLTPQSILAPHLARFEPPFRTILAETKPEDMRFDDLVERDSLYPWGIGAVTLLGDAAHPLLPHTGQGAAQALEDAVTLGLVLSPGGSIEEALRRYEEVRFRRTRPFVKLGRRIARMTTTRNALIQVVRTLAIRLVPERVLSFSSMRLKRDPHRRLRTGSGIPSRATSFDSMQ